MPTLLNFMTVNFQKQEEKLFNQFPQLRCTSIAVPLLDICAGRTASAVYIKAFAAVFCSELVITVTGRFHFP